MMFSLFKRKKNNSPLWKVYLTHFEKPLPQDLSKISFVVFDTETTGLDTNKDRVLSVGALRIENSSIDVSDTLDIYLDQDIFNPDTVEIHGIIRNHNFVKYSEYEVIGVFLQFIRNAILVGHHVAFDVKMINQILKRHHLPPLINQTLDTRNLFLKTKTLNYALRNLRNFSLDDICDELSIRKHDRHTALGDAYITAIAFLKILSRLGGNTIRLKQLISKNKV